MSDLYAQAAAAQGEVTADLTTGSEVPSGTVEETTPSPALSVPALTPEAVQGMISQALAQADQSWSKKVQSQLDRRDSNLIKRIEASKQQADRVAKNAKDLGGMDEAAAAALGQRFLNEDIAAMLDEANQPPAKNGKRDAQPAPDDGRDETTDPQQVAAYQNFITQQGDMLRDAYGMPYDAPEMRTVVVDQGEQAYFASIKAAGQDYRSRSAKTAQPAQPARVPGLGVDGGSAPRNPIANIDNPGELYKLAAKQVNRSPR